MWLGSVPESIRQSLLDVSQCAVIASIYNQELILDFPTLAVDHQEFETSKDNITTKFNATAMPCTAANSLFTAQVQNTVASYAS